MARRRILFIGVVARMEDTTTAEARDVRKTGGGLVLLRGGQGKFSACSIS